MSHKPSRAAEHVSPYNVIDHDKFWRGCIDDFSGEHEFLSNFYGYPFPVKGRWVDSAEHAYQAQKTSNPQWRLRIVHATSPGEAKRLGRQAPLRPEWESIKVEVMRQILRAKFPSAPPTNNLTAALLQTSGYHLVEGNTWGDTFWGCVHPTGKSNLWVGSNWLGILLMERRTQLQGEIPY